MVFSLVTDAELTKWSDLFDKEDESIDESDVLEAAYKECKAELLWCWVASRDFGWEYF